MNTVSSISSEKATSKCRKIHRPLSVISRKIVAFDALANLQYTVRSTREISAILEVPNSTMCSWRAHKSSSNALLDPLGEFLETPSGAEHLQRLVTAAVLVIEYGSSGVRGLQEYLHHSGLDQYVASSNGALHDYSKRIEQSIIAFGVCEERRLAQGMRSRKITAALDEMFRGRRPCLVAIEVVSNFILLEKFTEDRKAETWKREVTARLGELPIEIGQVVSDLCGALTSYTKDIGAQHSPDIFHGQHELTKATSAPLSSQERAFERAVSEADSEVKKAIKKHGENSEMAERAIGKRKLRKHGLEERTKRRETVRNAKKALGEIYHPVDIRSGQIQNADGVKKRVNEQMEIIKSAAHEAGLSQSCMERIAKAGRAFDAMVGLLTQYLLMLGLYINALQLPEDQSRFFLDVVFPFAYLRMILKRQSKEGQKKLQLLIESLEVKIREGPWTDALKQGWIEEAGNLAELFQRSSSCVEGRNGMLSLLHHRCHRLSTDRLKALTVVHNYHSRRADGSTAAERFFEQSHHDLFESLVSNVRIPGKPLLRKGIEMEKAKVA